ncbi:MAG: heme biosynthesis HemY N-terminal domain-containing protein [Parvibaculaceae bacterium]
MWRVLVPFGLLALLSGLAIWLADNPGTVTVLWRGYEIRTSFVAGLFAVSLTTFLVLLGYRLFATFMKSPAGFSSFLAARKRRKGYQALSKGMVAIAAGDTREADLYAAQAHKFLDEPAMTLLLAAQAAQLKGDSEGATHFFEEMRGHSETEFLGLRGLYVQADRAGNKGAARHYAEKAFELRPHTPWAAEAAFSRQAAAGDYEAAAKTLDKMLQMKLVTRDVARRRRAVLLTAEAMQAREADAAHARGLAAEAAELEPDFAPPVALAAELLAADGQARKAGRLIERAWATRPHADLADVYLTLIPDEKPFDRLRRVKGLAARNPGAGESQLVLARAALSARDFETARAAMEPLLKGEASQRVCELMGELEAADPNAEPQAARAWFARAVHAPADACWVADGYQGDEWVAVVPSTGAFDALNWQVPPQHRRARAALVPPDTSVAEAPAQPEEVEAEASGDAESAPAGEPEGDAARQEAARRTTLPEHVTIAPDDPGPEGSGLGEATGEGEPKRW